MASLLKEEDYELIMEVLSNFEFDRVHKTMVALNWQYADKNLESSDGIPDVLYLRASAKKLLKQAISECREEGYRSLTIATGGLEAYFSEEDYLLNLKFVVSDTGVYWENGEVIHV
jgi:hypothetical protein